MARGSAGVSKPAVGGSPDILNLEKVLGEFLGKTLILPVMRVLAETI